MSILNLGLQCIELMREKMGDEFEGLFARCNLLPDSRRIAQKNPSFSEALSDSISSQNSTYRKFRSS